MLSDLLKDIGKLSFLPIGSSALLMMTPLALTSFNRAIKALGARRWPMLHRAVYAVVLLGLLHFFWMRAAKNNLAEVLVHAAVTSLLLGWSVWHRRRARRTTA